MNTHTSWDLAHNATAAMNYTHTGNFALVTTATVGLQYISDHFYSLNQMSNEGNKIYFAANTF